MKGTTVVTDFKDLKKAIEEVTKNQPAETRYQQQAKKMGYTKDKSVVAEQTLVEKNLMPEIEKIVDTKGAKKVGGVMIDMFTASLLKKVYSKVNDSNKKKMEKANIDTLVGLAHKMMGKALNNSNNIDEGAMSDMLIDIQQGATAKELARDYKMPLSVAKSFLKDYYGQKKGNRKEGFASDAQRRAAFANGYKEKGKKKEKKEEIDEGKYTAYSDLLVMKARIIDKEGPKSNKLPAVDDAIRIAKKKLGIKESVNEDKMSLSPNLMKVFKRDIEKLMKKHDAYVSDSNSNYTTISSPKPVDSGFKKDLFKLLGMNEEQSLTEGTWAVPDSRAKLERINKEFLKKQVRAKNTAAVKKYARSIDPLFGDDSFSDDMYVLELVVKDEQKARSKYGEGEAGNLWSRGRQKIELNKDMDMRDVLVNHLGQWVDIKNYKITRVPEEWLEEPKDQMVNMGEAELSTPGLQKRKPGNIKRKRMKMVTFKEDEMSRAKEVIALQKKHEREKEQEKDNLEKEKEKAKQAADRAKANQANESFVTKSPFKLKSKQYPRAIATETQGFGKRHASVDDLLEACESFGMITEQELQLEKIERVLGKEGFLTYNKAELDDIFEDRETQRMILALESVTEETKPTEYDRETITKALEEDLNVEFTKPDGMKAMGPVLKMSGNTYNLKDMHTGKSFTFKYIDEDKKVKTFGQVISEARFSAKLVKQAGGIAFDKRYVGGNMTGAVNDIEKLKKGLSDDPKVRELLRIANESFNTPFFKEMNAEDQDAYVKFFQSALKKYDVTSPAQLSKEKKKEFFNYIDKNYKAKDEDVKENNIPHMCATHVEHGMWGSGICVSGDHDLIEQEDGSFEVEHYTVEFEHGIEELVSVSEIAITKAESHAHAMAKKAGRKKKKSEQQRIDARRKTFREKMRKLGYIKAR